MKNFFKLIAIISVFVCISSVNAQIDSTLNPTSTLYHKPVAIVEFNFGYVSSAFDFGGTIKDFYNITGYGVNDGYDAIYNTKYNLLNFNDFQLRTYLTVAYAHFQRTENRAYNINTWIGNKWPGRSMYDSTQPYIPPTDTVGSSKIVINSPYIGIGTELAYFADRERCHMFSFGVDFNINISWGKIYDKPAGKNQQWNNLVEATRFGLGFNLQYSFRPIPVFGLNAGTRLQISNLFGKTAEAVSFGGDLPLNDGENADFGKFGGARAIGFYGIYGGVSLYFQ